MKTAPPGFAYPALDFRQTNNVPTKKILGWTRTSVRITTVLALLESASGEESFRICSRNDGCRLAGGRGDSTSPLSIRRQDRDRRRAPASLAHSDERLNSAAGASGPES